MATPTPPIHISRPDIRAYVTGKLWEREPSNVCKTLDGQQMLVTRTLNESDLLECIETVEMFLTRRRHLSSGTPNHHVVIAFDACRVFLGTTNPWNLTCVVGLSDV